MKDPEWFFYRRYGVQRLQPPTTANEKPDPWVCHAVGLSRVGSRVKVKLQP
jgi:hypothetical protein